MRSKFCLLIVVMALVLASCQKDPEPEPTPDPATTIHFSVLGDSFSAMEGTVYPDSNDVWYIHESTNTTDVTQTEQMWWYQVAKQMGWVLDKNNSFSGSLISNFWGYNAGPYYAPHSFIRRMDHLGNPDVILVLGGTNDVWSGAYFGDYIYADWTEQQLEEYRPALAYLFDGLKRYYPNAKIYFLVDMYLSDYDPNGQRFVNSVHTIARHYQIDCIDLYDIQKQYAHPSSEGMTTIANQVVTALRQSY